MPRNRRAQGQGTAPPTGRPLLDEPSRLRELYSLRVLDTGYEERFDRITRLVADIFEVSVCLVTLIDEDLQWIKAAEGLNLRFQARADSFCTHALGHDLLVVKDARADPEFANKPVVVQAPHLRFYAGAVLHGPDGQPVGTLCILDRAPRDFGAADRRRLLEERLGAMVDGARAADAAVVLAVVRFLDFDRFLGAYGQEAVDRAARMFAQRLQAHTGTDGLVGRLAPDRMVVAARRAYGDVDVSAWSDAVYASLQEPYTVGTGQRRAPVSMGGRVLPVGREQRRRAGQPCHRGQGESARCGSTTVRARLRPAHTTRGPAASRLLGGPGHAQLSLAFQPIYSADGGGTVGLEALARSAHPVRGAVSPGEFIPLAESDPQLRRQLTRWVLSTACAAAAWNAARATPVSVSVNVAGPELHDASFLFEVERALSESGVQPALLVIELTERTLISDLNVASRSVRALAEQGVRCALDDFGTGYSSLSYLHSIPLQSRKMDRSFVAEVACDTTAREVARGIVNIGRALGMHVVAEGVETEEQRAHLEAIGCDHLQGFLLGRPVPAERVPELLAAD